MEYKEKEYTHIFDTPSKKQQESAVAYKIMDLLNKKKYDSIYEFIDKNKNYQDFLKNNEFNNVVKHFGNTLNEEEYIKILNEIIKLTESKKTFDKDAVKTTNIEDKEYVSYKGNDKTFFLDNSNPNSNMTITRELEELQKTQSEFQTTDKKKNTENMLKELEENTKESLNLKYLHEINKQALNEKEQKLFDLANVYQQNTQDVIRVDISRGLMVDKFDNILKIDSANNYLPELNNYNSEPTIENENENNYIKEKTLTLVPSHNTIYNNN